MFGVRGYGFGISSWIGPGLFCGVVVMGLIGFHLVYCYCIPDGYGYVQGV